MAGYSDRAVQCSDYRSLAYCPALLIAPGGTAQSAAATSIPYLMMHGDDPVAWQIWGESLAKAKAGNKPLFISSGYFACHWCHVMQRESYKTRKSLHCSINISYLPKWTVNWSPRWMVTDRFREAH